MLENIEVLLAMERLRNEWRDLLGDDADTLRQWLAVTSHDDPEAVRQTVNRLLGLLQKYPKAKKRLSSELGVKGDLHLMIRGVYEPPAGEPTEFPAGTLMVCPKDPNHYQRRVRQKGQQFFCSEHGVPLVPVDSLPPKE